MSAEQKETPYMTYSKYIGDLWSGVHCNQELNKKDERNKKIFWWDSDFVIRHVNTLVYDIDSPILSEGLNQLLINRLNGRVLKLGVSVGFGTGGKEMRLLELGVVEKFILFELSDEAIKIAYEKAKVLNLINRIEFVHGDAFAYSFENTEIELVHWNNSLHHMFDVRDAVKWSYDILSPGGVFYMDDYVGANRFQFPEYILKIVDEIRNGIPYKYLKHPFIDGYILGPYINHGLDEINDPSEAVDSERILESVRIYFPKAKIILTGGIVYSIALAMFFDNFDEENEEDLAVLKQLLTIDMLHNSIDILELDVIVGV